MILKVIPRTATCVECRALLECDIGVVAHLFTHLRRA